jgi:hypothetical protein
VHRIFEAYAPPLHDGFLYQLASEVRMHGSEDLDELVQEGRIRMWQLWQEEQWSRVIEPRGVNFYAKAVKRRMQAVCYRRVPAFGAIDPRQGYSDLTRHVTASLDRTDEDGDVPAEIRRLAYETPFELLDRIPAVLLGLVG